MSVQEETQGGAMKGGGREEDLGGGSKRIQDEEQNTEQEDRQDECLKKRRMRSENWSAEETLQMLELRKAIVQTSTAKGSDAWKQIAQKLAGKSQARSWKQVSQRWDTLVRVFVSVEEQCCETGKSFGEVIGERQKRCKTEYSQSWHELIAQGNPGKRRAPGKPAVQPDEAPTACSVDGIITQATPASLSPDASLAVMTHAWKFGEIAKLLTEMLDTVDRSISFSEKRSEVLGRGDHKNIGTGSKIWEYEEDQERGLKNQQDETNAEVARITQLMAESMQTISKAASRSESFCLEVDVNDWLMVIERLSAISQRFQTLSVQRISEEVGADVRIPRVKIISATRSTYDLNNSIQPTLSVISPATSTDIFTTLSDVEPLSPGLSDVMSLVSEPSDYIMSLVSEPSDYIMALSRKSAGTSSTMDDLDVSLSQRKIDVGAIDADMENFDVFLNHRSSDVKATFVAHLEDALRYAGHRPFLEARSLMKGNPALLSIDLQVAQVHIAVVCRGYAESEFCLNELVAMIRSGKPVIPVFYDVEPRDLRCLEDGPFAEAFEKHKLKGTTENKVQEWADALRALADLKITGFNAADFESDEHKLNREVVKQVSRLIPSIEPVEVEDYNVDLRGRTESYILMLENMKNCTGMLGLFGMGGIGKTTLARNIFNDYVAEKKFRCMTFLGIPRDPSASSVQVRPTWSTELRKQLLRDLLGVHDSTSNYIFWFQEVSTLGPVMIVIDNVYILGQFEMLIPSTSFLHLGRRIIITGRDRSILVTIAERNQRISSCLFDVTTLDWNESNMLFNWHAFQAEVEAPSATKISPSVLWNHVAVCH